MRKDPFQTQLQKAAINVQQEIVTHAQQQETVTHAQQQETVIHAQQQEIVTHVQQKIVSLIRYCSCRNINSKLDKLKLLDTAWLASRTLPSSTALKFANTLAPATLDPIDEYTTSACRCIDPTIESIRGVRSIHRASTSLAVETRLLIFLSRNSIFWEIPLMTSSDSNTFTSMFVHLESWAMMSVSICAWISSALTWLDWQPVLLYPDTTLTMQFRNRGLRMRSGCSPNSIQKSWRKVNWLAEGRTREQLIQALTSRVKQSLVQVVRSGRESWRWVLGTSRRTLLKPMKQRPEVQMESSVKLAVMRLQLSPQFSKSRRSRLAETSPMVMATAIEMVTAMAILFFFCISIDYCGIVIYLQFEFKSYLIFIAYTNHIYIEQSPYNNTRIADNNKIMSYRMIRFMLVVCLTVSVATQPSDQTLDYDEMQKQQASMKRTACLVLSRYHSNTHKDMVQEIVTSLQPEDQTKYINKMYAMAIERCLPSITPEQAQLFFSASELDPSSLFYLLDGFEYAEAADNLDSLTPNQRALIKFIKQFDEEMQVQKQERQAKKEQDTGYESSEAISIFGIDLNNFGSTAGVAYLVIFGSIVAGGLCWGFSNLNNSALPRQKNKKDSKKEKKKNA